MRPNLILLSRILWGYHSYLVLDLFCECCGFPIRANRAIRTPGVERRARGIIGALTCPN